MSTHIALRTLLDENFAQTKMKVQDVVIDVEPSTPEHKTEVHNTAG